MRSLVFFFIILSFVCKGQSGKRKVIGGILIGEGINSYIMRAGVVGLAFPYRYTDLKNNTVTSTMFVSHGSFTSRKFYPEIPLTLQFYIRKYFYADLGLSCGSIKHQRFNIDIGGGLVLPMSDKRFSLRAGLSFFAAQGEDGVARIDNQNKDVTIENKVFHSYYYTTGRHGTTYYHNARYIDVFFEGASSGLKPKLTLCYQPTKSNLVFQLNVAYNFLLHETQYVHMEQEGTSSSTKNNNSKEFMTRNLKDSYYSYIFTGHGPGPFSCKGWMINAQIGLKLYSSRSYKRHRRSH